MRPKAYPIQIWFLDEDLTMSAQLLPDKQLSKTISGCMQALVTARMYVYGIRSNRFYKYYFDKARKAETMDKLFPLWPFSTKPSFQQFGSQASKWCRKCLEHYSYIRRYFSICLEEHEFRKGSPHATSTFVEWNDIDAPAISFPEAHLAKVHVPWKVLPPQFRSKDIESGYRKHLKHVLDRDGGVTIGAYTKRDIPEFLLQESIASEHLG